MQKLNPKSDGNSKMVGVKLTDKQIKFIKKKGKVSTVIRELIEREMKEGA